jgi:RHS repeat-associated protein
MRTNLNKTHYYYDTDVISYSDYYPFGSLLPGRYSSSADYRYGFNGMEHDDEIKTDLNSYDFGSRIYDPRLGRWLSPDKVLQSKESPYSYVNDNPVIYVDRNGEDNVIYLVALPSAKSKVSITDPQSIADRANDIYESMGLNTRVVVFESDQPFDPAHIDPSDSYALLGSVSELKSTVKSSSFSNELRLKSEDLGSHSADQSVVGGKGILLNTEGVANYSKKTGDSQLDVAANTLVHGSGHNAGFNHSLGDDILVTKNAEFNKYSNKGTNLLMIEGHSQLYSITGDSHEGGFFVEGVKDVNSLHDKSKNSKFTFGLKNSFFGNKTSKDNYGFNKVNKQKQAEGKRPVKKGEL